MKFLFSVVLLILSFSVNAQKNGCDSLHTGSFSSVSKIDGKDAITIITRTEHHQIEENATIGVIMSFDIKWTSDCSYELSNPTFLKGDMPGTNKMMKMYIQIKEVFAHSYTAEVSSNFYADKMTMEITIL